MYMLTYHFAVSQQLENVMMIACLVTPRTLCAHDWMCRSQIYLYVQKKTGTRGWFTARFLCRATTVSSGVSQYRWFHLPGACRERRDIRIVLLDTLPFTGHRFSLADSQINIFKATQATEWYWTNNLCLTHKSFREVCVRFQEIEKVTLFLSAFFQILIAKKSSLFYQLHCNRVIA